MKGLKDSRPEVFEVDVPMTQAKFGRLVGVSQSAVSDMQARGVLPAEGIGHAWVLAYCEHLREIAAGRMSESGDDGLTVERTRLTKEQADAMEMKNQVSRGELAPVVQLEDVLARASSKVAGIFDAIPAKVRRRLPDLPPSAVRLITEEISKARNIVGAMTLADVAPDEATDEESTESED